MNALIALLPTIPGFWGFCAVGLALLLSTVTAVWMSINKTRRDLASTYARWDVELYKATTERQRVHKAWRDKRDLARKLGTKPPETRSGEERSELPAVPPRRKRDRRRRIEKR